MIKAVASDQQNAEVASTKMNFLPVWLVILLLGSYAIISIVYALLIPKGLPYDEPSHFYYVAHLAGLKNFVDRGSYELAIQPPLAYLIYTPFFKIFLGTNITNLFFSLRLITVIEGTASLYFSLLVLAELMEKQPQRQLIVITAAAVAAFNPASIAVNSSITNDTLLQLETVLILWLVIKIAKKPTGYVAKKELLWLGLLIGLAGATKALALPLLAMPTTLLILRIYQDKRELKNWKWFAIATMLAIILATPFYLYNQLQYNDPFGAIYWQNTVQQNNPFRFTEIDNFVSLTFATYWSFANFLRDLSVVKPSKIEYVFFLFLSLCPVISLSWKVVTRHKLRRNIKVEHKAVAAFVLFTVIGYLLKELQDYSPNGRYLASVSVIFSLLIVYSIYELIPKNVRIKKVWLYGITIFMISYSVFAAFYYLLNVPNLYPHLFENMILGSN